MPTSEPHRSQTAGSYTSSGSAGCDHARELQEHRVGGTIDTSKVASPIVGFIFDDKVLMYNLTLEGSKSAA